jgi:hypothetical protein
MKLVPFAILVALGLAHDAVAPVQAGELQPAASQAGQAPPFTATLSNNTPLAFGMTTEEAAAALGSPLGHVGGRRGDDIMIALRSNGGSGFFPRRDRLYLQFRQGRLAGWKGDWGHHWMWQ